MKLWCQEENHCRTLSKPDSEQLQSLLDSKHSKHFVRLVFVVSLSVCLSCCLCILQSDSIDHCIYICLSMLLSFLLAVYLIACLSVCLTICLFFHEDSVNLIESFRISSLILRSGLLTVWTFWLYFLVPSTYLQ